MLLIPAIDLQDGHCVRLRQGDLGDSTVFSDDPGAMAQQWLDQGARRLHLVDLNGAVAGKPKNLGAIKAIVDAVDNEIPIQLGGGIRDLDTIEQYLTMGFLCHYWHRGRKTLVFCGRLQCIFGAYHRWARCLTARSLPTLECLPPRCTRPGPQIEDYGCEAIIYTDIARDGMPLALM